MPDDPEITRWLARMRTGDQEAFAFIWQRYYSRIVHFAQGRLPVAGDIDADGLAASAFKSFWRAVRDGHFPDLNDRDQLWSSLITVTSRKVADLLKRRNAKKRGGGMRRAAGEALETVPDDGEDEALRLEAADTLARLFERLGDDRLRSIAWRRMEGSTVDEIAAAVGCSRRTVVLKLKLIRQTWQEKAQE